MIGGAGRIFGSGFHGIVGFYKVPYRQRGVGSEDGVARKKVAIQDANTGAGAEKTQIMDGRNLQFTQNGSQVPIGRISLEGRVPIKWESWITGLLSAFRDVRLAQSKNRPHPVDSWNLGQSGYLVASHVHAYGAQPLTPVPHPTRNRAYPRGGVGGFPPFLGQEEPIGNRIGGG
jgi:hypothetical protein